MIFKFLKLALAALRLTILITKDDFPPVTYLRDDWAIWRPKWREFLICPRCVGFHCAWIVLLMERFCLSRFLVDALALAGLNVLIHDWWKEKHNE